MLDDILKSLKLRPATVQTLMEELTSNRDDVHNKLRTLRNRGSVWVMNIPPMWFVKGYKLRESATNEEIREWALAMWERYDSKTQDPIRRANVILTEIERVVPKPKEPKEITKYDNVDMYGNKINLKEIERENTKLAAQTEKEEEELKKKFEAEWERSSANPKNQQITEEYDDDDPFKEPI